MSDTQDEAWSDFPNFVKPEHRQRVLRCLKGISSWEVADACEMIEWMEREIQSFIEQHQKDYDFYMNRIRKQEQDIQVLEAEIHTWREWAKSECSCDTLPWKDCDRCVTKRDRVTRAIEQTKIHKATEKQ